MVWPPDPLPNNRSNITPMLNEHPTDHNDIANTLADDFVEQISENIAAIGVNTGNIGVNAAAIITGDAATLAAALAEQIARQDLDTIIRTTTPDYLGINNITIHPTRSVGVTTLHATIDLRANVGVGTNTFVARIFVSNSTPLVPEIIWAPQTDNVRITLNKTWVVPVISNIAVVYTLQIAQVAGSGAFTTFGIHTTLEGVFVG